MKPAGGAFVVGRLHDAAPRVEDRIAVELAAETCDPPAHRWFLEADRVTAVVRRPTGRIDRLERRDERGQIERRFDGIAQRVQRCHLAR